MTEAPWRRTISRRFRRSADLPLTSFLVTLCTTLLVAALLIHFLECRMRPIVSELAQAQAVNRYTAVLERAALETISGQQTGYNDIVTIHRTEDGTITALTTDQVALNLLKGQITEHLLSVLDETDVSLIRIPLGSLFDFDPLWAMGPELQARSMSVGTIRAEFSSNFTSAGVNQTLHRISLHMSIPLTLILPGTTVDVSVESELCVAETVIVGQVPDAYLQQHDLTSN